MQSFRKENSLRARPRARGLVGTRGTFQVDVLLVVFWFREAKGHPRPRVHLDKHVRSSCLVSLPFDRTLDFECQDTLLEGW